MILLNPHSLVFVWSIEVDVVFQRNNWDLLVLGWGWLSRGQFCRGGEGAGDNTSKNNLKQKKTEDLNNTRKKCIRVKREWRNCLLHRNTAWLPRQSRGRRMPEENEVNCVTHHFPYLTPPMINYYNKCQGEICDSDSWSQSILVLKWTLTSTVKRYNIKLDGNGSWPHSWDRWLQLQCC